jgi:hypothetical protein
VNLDRGKRSKRWLGRTEFLTRTIQSEPRLESAKPLRERNGALLRVLAEVLLKTCLTSPTLLEMAIFRQLRGDGSLIHRGRGIRVMAVADLIA